MIDREEIRKLAKNIQSHAFKRGYVSAFTLTAFPVPTDQELALHITRECTGLVYGNAEVGSTEAYRVMIEELDGRVDYIFADSRLRDTLSDTEHFDPVNVRTTSSVFHLYLDMDVWVSSIFTTLLTYENNLPEENIVLIHHEKIEPYSEHSLTSMVGTAISMKIGNEKLSVVSADEGQDAEERRRVLKDADIIIGTTIYTPCITKKHLEIAGGNPLIIDAGIGTITPEASEYAREKGMKMIRVDNRAAMAGTLLSLIQSHDLVNRVMGEGEIDGVKVIAGGIVGAPGTVIVDSIDNPSMAIGIADGTGKVVYEPEKAEWKASLEKVRKKLAGGSSDG